MSSWIPKTYETRCPMCQAVVTANFLSPDHVFTEKAFLLDAQANVVLDDKKEKTNLDINLLCESCRSKFGITITPERQTRAEFAAPELDPRLVAEQIPSLGIRNDSSNMNIIVWADTNISGPNQSPSNQFVVRPNQLASMSNVWIGWLMFITRTDPTVTIITTNAPFITEINMWDESAHQMSGKYPVYIWPQFTNGQKEHSANLDVNDKLMFIHTPFYSRLLKDKLVKPEDLNTLTLKEANQLMSKAY